MGRCEFEVIGEGFTESEAIDNAIKEAEDYYGHQEGYSGSINSWDRDHPYEIKCIQKPKITNSIIIEKNPKFKTQKWATFYKVYVESNGGFDMDIYKLTSKNFKTLVDAKKDAKSFVLNHNKSVTIRKEKVLIEGETTVLEVKKRGNNIKGKWRIKGWAKT